jgi:hypothetical protein
MKSWFSQLLALLVRRDRAHAPRRVDWRGRPLAESADGTIRRVSATEGASYTTLSPPSLDDATRQSARQQPVPTRGEER